MQKYSIFLCLFASFSAFSQNELDALRYSNDGLQGTARALGVGGAMSAVGADLSAASLNPAGLGLYQFSDFGITFNSQPTSEEINYFDGKQTFKQNPFFMQSLGMAIRGRVFDGHGSAKETGLKSYNIAFGYQRLDNYRSNYQIEGYNRYNSITDYFAQAANGQGDADLQNINYPAAAAYQSYAINPIAGQNNQYFGAFPGGGLQQTIDVSQSGRKGETYIALAGNINDKLYVGAKIGFQNIKYEQRITINENDINNIHETYNDNLGSLDFPARQFEYKESFQDAGSGINGQFGIIYRPINNLRIGASILSPTRVSLSDDYQFSVRNIFLQNGQDTTINIASDILISNYSIKTPYQYNLGVAYLIGKHGFISADVNIKDYSKALLSSDLERTDESYYSYDTENGKIRQYLKNTINYRLGGEYRLNHFRVRAGAGLMVSPLAESVSKYQDSSEPTKLISYNTERQYFTGGLGYRAKEYYIDLAYIHQTQKTVYAPYLLAGSSDFTPNVVNNRVTQNIVVTMGLCF